MITLATAAYAHQTDVNAYRLTSDHNQQDSEVRGTKCTIIFISEKNGYARAGKGEHSSRTPRFTA
jgi:hypothetical protein